MEDDKKLEKMLENWWYYRKWSAIILLIVLVAVGYMISLNTHSISYDFYVGVVTRIQMPPEELEALQERLDAAAWDRNHDGEVRVMIWTYKVDLDADSITPGDQVEIGKLDGDLASKRSGMFFVDNPEGAKAVLNHLDGEAVPIAGTNLYAIVTSEHMEHKDYENLLMIMTS